MFMYVCGITGYVDFFLLIFESNQVSICGATGWVQDMLTSRRALVHQGSSRPKLPSDPGDLGTTHFGAYQEADPQWHHVRFGGRL